MMYQYRVVFDKYEVRTNDWLKAVQMAIAESKTYGICELEKYKINNFDGNYVPILTEVFIYVDGFKRSKVVA